MREELEIFSFLQNSYHKIGQLKDLITAIDILSVNLLEHKNRKIYKDKYTVFEVTQIVYDALVSGQDNEEIREMI